MRGTLVLCFIGAVESSVLFLVLHRSYQWYVTGDTTIYYYMVVLRCVEKRVGFM